MSSIGTDHRAMHRIRLALDRHQTGLAVLGVSVAGLLVMWLLVLNEPETSLHPELLQPLARLIARAAERAQVIVVSHAERLVAELAAVPGCALLALHKELGETVVADAERSDWSWPKR